MTINKKEHAGQLTLGDVYKLIEQCKRNFPNWEDIPVYLGDDEKLNGIHSALFKNLLLKSFSDRQYYENMINERCSNHKLGDDEVAILLS